MQYMIRPHGSMLAEQLMGWATSQQDHSMHRPRKLGDSPRSKHTHHAGQANQAITQNATDAMHALLQAKQTGLPLQPLKLS